jgi:hypothetical protein
MSWGLLRLDRVKPSQFELGLSKCQVLDLDGENTDYEQGDNREHEEHNQGCGVVRASSRKSSAGNSWLFFLDFDLITD